MYKYYKINLMNNSFKYFALSMLLATMTGCTADDIVQVGGTLPDETPMNSVGGQLHSEKTFLQHDYCRYVPRRQIRNHRKN